MKVFKKCKSDYLKSFAVFVMTAVMNVKKIIIKKNNNNKGNDRDVEDS